jgi:hypothetical protein
VVGRKGGWEEEVGKSMISCIILLNQKTFVVAGSTVNLQAELYFVLYKSKLLG